MSENPQLETKLGDFFSCLWSSSIVRWAEWRFTGERFCGSFAKILFKRLQEQEFFSTVLSSCRRKKTKPLYHWCSPLDPHKDSGLGNTCFQNHHFLHWSFTDNCTCCHLLTTNLMVSSLLKRERNRLFSPQYINKTFGESVCLLVPSQLLIQPSQIPVCKDYIRCKSPPTWL